jgi:hypothetical protein
MEKASLIFSILTHDHDFMMWFWLFITMPVGGWHLFYFWSKKQLTEKQLIEISADFEGINGTYIGFSIVAIGLLIGFPFMVLAPGLNKWALLNYGMKFYPSVVFINAGYGIYQSLFALMKGVYPMAKSLSYIYDDKAKIHSVAKYQILISIAAVIFVSLFFFATV